MKESLIEALREAGIETERELDAALKRTAFSLGIMASVADSVPVPFPDREDAANY